MGKLREKQSEFMRALGLLITYAYSLGYELTGGDLWAKEGEGRPHIKKSKHYRRLAIDLNLFKDGKYQSNSIAHLPLGEYWEKLGGIWGGFWSGKDGNHYEWPV